MDGHMDTSRGALLGSRRMAGSTDSRTLGRGAGAVPGYDQRRYLRNFGLRSRPASSLAVGGVAGRGTWTWAEPVDATVSTLSGRFGFLTAGFKATDSTDALAAGSDALKAGIAASTATAGGAAGARVLDRENVV